MHSDIKVLAELPKESEMLACTCEYNGDIKQLIAKLKDFRKKYIMQIFSDRKDVETALLPAYINAKLRAHEGLTRADDLNIDFMLLVARTMKIDEALKAYGANSGHFIFFSEDRKAGLEFLKKNGVRIIKEIGLKLDPKISESIALTELLED